MRGCSDGCCLGGSVGAGSSEGAPLLAVAQGEGPIRRLGAGRTGPRGSGPLPRTLRFPAAAGGGRVCGGRASGVAAGPAGAAGGLEDGVRGGDG